MRSKGIARKSARRGGSDGVERRRKPVRQQKLGKNEKLPGLGISSEDIVTAMKRGIYKAMRTHIAAGVPMVSSKNGVTVHHSVREMKAMLKKAEAEGLA